MHIYGMSPPRGRILQASAWHLHVDVNAWALSCQCSILNAMLVFCCPSCPGLYCKKETKDKRLSTMLPYVCELKDNKRLLNFGKILAWIIALMFLVFALIFIAITIHQLLKVDRLVFEVLNQCFHCIGTIINIKGCLSFTNGRGKNIGIPSNQLHT